MDSKDRGFPLDVRIVPLSLLELRCFVFYFRVSFSLPLKQRDKSEQLDEALLHVRMHRHGKDQETDDLEGDSLRMIIGCSHSGYDRRRL